MNKKEIIAQWAGAEDRSGTIEAQIGLLTARVKVIATHIEKNHKDYSSKLGLLKLVCKRRRLIKYLATQDSVKAKEFQQRIKG